MDSFKLDEKDNLKSSFKRRPIITTLLVVFVGWLLFSLFSIDSSVSSRSTSVQPSVALEQRDIVVTSQTVKRIDGKYRYFFDIRNNDDRSFVGNVDIKLKKANGSTLGQGDFEATTPIEPGFGDSVYIDVNTGPRPDFGPDVAITGFSYDVISGSQLVSSGSGDIVVPDMIEHY